MMSYGIRSNRRASQICPTGERDQIPDRIDVLEAHEATTNDHRAMKFILHCLIPLLLTSIRADTTEAVSEVFDFDLRDSAGTKEATSGMFALEARNRGNFASESSGGFSLNTFGAIPTGLVIEGPPNVAAGSVTDYFVKWNRLGQVLDVTADARWRFIGGAPGNTGMVPPSLYAGKTASPATVTLVASYLGPGGVSVETPPFTVTILPALGVETTVTRGAGGEVTFSAAATDPSGPVTLRWDLDGDGEFDDATGTTVIQDFGTWTGSKSAAVEVTDAAGNRAVKYPSGVINKPPVANQPVVAKPAYDPGGFSLGLASASSLPTPFLFNSGGLDRRNSGLVVIAHGLYVDSSTPWVRDMALGIENRCGTLGMVPPNIALLDWSQLAKDPSELSALHQAVLRKLIEKGKDDLNLKALGTGVAGFAINFVFDAYSVRKFGLVTGQSLANWIYLNSTQGGTPQIDAGRPIHLIGHSAGGFITGEAARILKYMSNPVTVDRVTLLDNPFAQVSHLATGGKNYPNPGTVDRVMSSVYGTLETPFTIYPLPHPWYRHVNLDSLYKPGSVLNTGDKGHGNSHVWYRETIWNAGFSAEGFTLSPIINPSTRAPRGGSASRALQFRPPGPAIADFIPTGWQSFGAAEEDSGTWSLAEESDAGMWTDMTMPVEAGNLNFEFQFTGAGDGDFLAVHFGDLPVLFQGLDLALSRDGWVSAEVPLDFVEATPGKLVFTLVSRGNVNAQLQVKNIRVTRSNDPDSDGLTVAQEEIMGTDPRNWDSDGDGLVDGEEVNTLLTDPLAKDTDGDGQEDNDELTAGTDPRQSGSIFRVTGVQREAGGSMRLEWPGVSGKSYRVFRSQDLGTGNYELMADEVPGVAPTTTFTDSIPPNGRAFYWLEVR